MIRREGAKISDMTAIDPSSAPRFVHLRMHSEFSIVDGITRMDEAVKKAADDGQPALALTDLANTFGFIKFYKAARSKGVKPLLGADVWITNEAIADQPFRALLLIQNSQGYTHLCELLSRAWLTNAQRDRGELRWHWFQERNTRGSAALHEGLLMLSGAHLGEVGQHLSKGTPASVVQAEEAAARAQAIFTDRFYLEVQRCGREGEEALNQQTLLLAQKLGIAVVATHPIQYLDPEDHRSHEARVCIATGETLANPRRVKRFTAQQHLTTQAEMAEKFADLPQALANTLVVAQRCNLTLQLGKPQLPDFPTPNGESLEDYLRSLSAQGLEQRLLQRFPNEAQREAARPTYEARLELECNTIIQMGFPGYFLIVADFINWAKNNGVPVGPGRGSGAGSLVAYSLGITDLDPLPYSLLFERFLNPERVSMPDFDIDFCQERRQRVIEYVRERYGRDAVSQIVTFGTMASRAVIRDAGRVLELPYNFCDQLSKLIPVVQNKPLSLREAREKEPILAEREQKEDEVRELLAVAEPLEDLTRNIGMHAGGVLIAPGRLTDFCPLYQAPGSEGADGVVSMYDKDDVEAAGLVKFDFLGLRNLTIIQLAVETINRLYPERPQGPLKLDDLNGFDDPAAYTVLKEANTTAIFQVESQGMKRYLVKLQPDRFEDIIAMLALYRPGPLNSGMVDDFILRKRGQQKVDYFHEDLKECLSPTYGVIVYQEQVMQIAQIMAGYTLGGADLLRRAMGKKKPEEMAQQRSIFLEGAQKKGHSEALATQLFDLMEKFAEYGFNKSHTAAYAVITYQTAWLKAHYPAEFLAATLSSDMDDTDKVAFLVQDAKANGLGVLPPDINLSQYRFEPVRGVDEQGLPQQEPSERSRAIRYGLGAVRGVGESAVQNILAAREQGPFKDLFDFCARVDRRVVNKRAMEALVKAGALDGLHPKGSKAGRAVRATLVAQIALACQAADDAEANAHQGGLFGDADPASLPTSSLSQSTATPYSPRETLLEEKVALGYCFSGSLFDSAAKELRRYAGTPLARVVPSREPLWIAGVVVDSRAQMTKRGMMRVIALDDGSARMEVTVFNELFESRKSVLRVDEPLLVSARIDNDEYSGGLRGSAVEILTMTEVRLRHAKALAIRLQAKATERQSPERQARELIERLRTAVAAARPPIASQACPVVVELHTGQEVCSMRLGPGFAIAPSDENLSALAQAFGADDVQLVYV